MPKYPVYDVYDADEVFMGVAGCNLDYPNPQAQKPEEREEQTPHKE
jgi:hypothetical protein